MEIEFDKKEFALRLKEIRKSKGLTQEDVCEITGIEISNYSKMETGKVAPSLQSLQKLIKLAGFIPNELFNYTSLNNEESIDQIIFEMYAKFSLSKKQLLYKIMRDIEEFQ